MRLTAEDEGLHQPGRHPGWSESRYVDVFDRAHRVGAWLRLGCRPNQARADVSVCVYLPDGRVAVWFDRPELTRHGFAAGGLRWEVLEPFRRSRAQFRGEVVVLDDP